jgi:nitroreductase
MQLEEFARLARARRTHMLVEKDRPVPQPLVEELCEVGTWAPAHKKTWPW